MVSFEHEPIRRHPAASFSARGVLRGAAALAPLSLFVAPFGVAFGVAATEHGLAPWVATLMSALVFTATAQFAALDFLTEPIAYGSLGIVVLALSARHIVMGAAVARWLNTLPATRRLLALAVLSDANYADSLPRFQAGEADVGRLFGGGLMLWSSWVASTAIGAFGGGLVPGQDTAGFAIILPCFFAATLVQMVRGSARAVPDQMRGFDRERSPEFQRDGQSSRTACGAKCPRSVAPVCVAAVISAILLPVLPTGWNIIAAAVSGGIVAVFAHAE